jgi:hypothetical protein
MKNKTAIQKGVYNKLNTILGSGVEAIYFETVPGFGQEGYSLNDNGYPELATPYIVFYLEDNRPEYTFESTSERFILEVNIIDQNPSSAQVNILEDTLCEGMDRTDITTVDGYNTVKCVRIFSNTIAINGVWQHISRYDIELQEA